MNLYEARETISVRQLFALRETRQRPEGLIEVQVGGAVKYDPDVWVRDLRQDLRAFVGLDLCVWSDSDSFRDLARAFSHADTLIVRGSDLSGCAKWRGKKWEEPCN